jgi:spore germination protein
MVGQLDTQQTALLLAMMGRAPKAESVFIASGLEGESPFKKGAAFTIREGRRKIRLDLQDRRLAIDIHLDLLGVLDEYDQDLLDRAGPQEELEERLSKEIQENCFGILGYAQRLGSDPIGFGDLVRAKYYSAWKTMNWEEVYREATVNVAVKVEIRQFGLIK